MDDNELIELTKIMNDNELIELTKITGQYITIQKNKVVAVSRLENYIIPGCRIYLLAAEEPIGVKETYESVIQTLWG